MLEGHIKVTRAIITGASIRDAALRQGAVVYLVWDERAQRVFVVQWNRVAWRCSCHHTTACEHKMAANQVAVELSQQQRKEQEGGAQ